jgi:hypothetical protein
VRGAPVRVTTRSTAKGSADERRDRSRPVHSWCSGGPTSNAEVADQSLLGPHLVPRDENVLSAQFRLDFADQAAAASCILALASLFSGIAEELVAIDVHGQPRDDLDLNELQQRLKSKRIASLRLRAPIGLSVAQVTISAGASISVGLPIAAHESGAWPLWLQADPEHLGPLPLLASPVVDGAFTARLVLTCRRALPGGAYDHRTTDIIGGVRARRRHGRPRRAHRRGGCEAANPAMPLGGSWVR